MCVFQFMSQDEMKTNVEVLSRLQAGMEQARDELEGINEEERLLEWEQSFFPQLQQMFTLKEPYDKLWNTAWAFHLKHESWMNGRWQHVILCHSNNNFTVFALIRIIIWCLLL